MAIIRSANLQTVAPQAAPNAMPQANADIASFGGTQARDTMVAGQQLEKASDSLANVALAEMKEANDARIDDLNNQFVVGMQKTLWTDEGSFLRKKGKDAIENADVATQALAELQKGVMAQAANGVQRAALNKRLDYHVADASGLIARHVGAQATVYHDAVAKGTSTNAVNQMVLENNNLEKLTALGDTAYQAEFNRVLKETGSPEASKASATAVSSKGYLEALSALAVTNPKLAQRGFEANRGKLSGADAVALEKTIKDATIHRKSQDIVNLVTATGGVSPNYNAKVKGAEGGSTFIENKIGALGDFQMTKDTYTDLAQGTDWGKGKTQAEIRALLLDPKEGAKRQEELQGRYNERSKEALGQAGLPVNDLTLYTTHFLGHGAGPAILKLPDDTPLQAGLIKAHGGDAAYAKLVVDSNPFLAKVETVGDLKALMAQKISAPQTLVSGSPQKPNLDQMLSAGRAMAGTDQDLSDKVSAGIVVDYGRKLTIYNAQTQATEKQAFAHIDNGGTIESLPPQIKGALDSDSMVKVGAYEARVLEKRRKQVAEDAGKGLADLERLGQLTEEDVVKQRNNLTDKEYRSWGRIARGDDRTDDSDAYQRLQRGLGTRDMRDDIYAEHAAGGISNQTRGALLEKNAAFMKESAPATPYKINHERIERALSVGIADNPIARELFGKAMKEYDLYVKGNSQREGETETQYSRRLSDYSEDTVRRYTMLKMQDISATQPVPAHTTFKRSDMSTLPRLEATARVVTANNELKEKYQKGEITEEQYGADAVVLEKWLDFINKRPDPPAPTPARK